MKNLEYLWKKLEGTEEEKAYLENRFNEMSVKEQYILEGAKQIVEVKNASDIINLTEQLNNFDFHYKATDNESLGEYVARHKECASDDILPFIKTEQLGSEYHEGLVMMEHLCLRHLLAESLDLISTLTRMLRHIPQELYLPEAVRLSQKLRQPREQPLLH